MKEKDEILIQRVLAGDTEAFGELVDRYKGAVFALAFHEVGNFEDAKDIAQEAFIKAYTKLSSLRQKSSFASWLKKITWSIASHWLRDASRRREFFIEDITSVKDIPAHRDILPSSLIAPRSESPDEKLERKELHEQIFAALDALSEPNKLTTILYYMDGLTYQEIAEFQGVPVSTVKGRLYQSRKKLKKEMLGMLKESLKAHAPGGGFTESALKKVEMRENTEERHWLDEYPYIEEQRPDGTHLLGTIHGHIRWTADKYPYILEENVFVAEGATLSIEPGVVIKVVRLTEPRTLINAYVKLHVNGRLLAIGRPDNMIRFTSYSSTLQPPFFQQHPNREWQGINFWRTSAHDSRLEWTIVENAIHGVKCYGSPSIKHNVFRRCHAGIYLERDFVGTVVHNVSTRNAWSAIRCKGTRAEATIVNNIFYDNGDGIDASADATAYSDYNLYWKNRDGDYSRGMQPGPNDLFADPLFVDVDAEDYRIADDSPARGAGLNGADIGLFVRGWKPEAEVCAPEPNPQSFWIEGLSLERRNSPSEAQSKYESALSLHPEPDLHVKLACGLARMLILQGEFDEAKRRLEGVFKVAEHLHQRDLVRRYLADAQAKGGEPKQAVKTLGELEWNQSHVWAESAMASYTAMAGDVEDALKGLEHLIDTEPDRYMKGVLGMVEDALTTGQLDKARQVIVSADTYASCEFASKARVLIAETARQRGQTELAVEMLELEYRLAPFSLRATDALVFLAEIFEIDLRDMKSATRVREELVTQYWPMDKNVAKVRSKVNIPLPPREQMVLLDSSLGKACVFDRMTTGSYGQGQYEVAATLKEAGYVVHTNAPYQYGETQLTSEQLQSYGLVICNGIYFGG